MSRFEDYDDLTAGSLNADELFAQETAEFDETTPAYTFPTDGSSNIAGEGMHDLLRAVYDRDDRATVAAIELVNYNETGGGWFADPSRFQTGLRFLVRDGDNGIVEALTLDNKGNLSVAGSIEGIEDSDATPDRTLIAEPGGLVDTMAYATAGDLVRLYAGETYTISEELFIGEDIRLDGNGATIEPSGDHNVIFMGLNTQISNFDINVRDVPFSSKAISLDAVRLGDSYHGSGGGVAIDNVFVSGTSTTMGGDGLYINVGDKQWYSANSFHRFGVSGLENGLHADVDAGGHANANTFNCLLWNNGTQIRHSGGGPFESQIYTELDATSGGQQSDHMIVNEPDTGRTCMVYGKMYDPFNCTGDYLVGTVNMQHHGRPHVSILENSPNANGIIQSQDRNEIQWLDLGNQMGWRILFYSGGWMRWQYDTSGDRNYSDMITFRPLDGQIRMHDDIVASSESVWVNDVDFGGGAGILKNSSGELIARDESGNTTTLT